MIACIHAVMIFLHGLQLHLLISSNIMVVIIVMPWFFLLETKLVTL